MGPSKRRLIAFLAGTPLCLALCAYLYMLGMEHLEGVHRTFWENLGWASETFTTTGYGRDSHWHHPLMVVYVAGVQLLGVSVTFIVVSLLVLPFFEARFESRLPRSAPKMRDYVLVYHWGPAVASLTDELRAAKVPTLLLEEDEAIARRLFDRGRNVVHWRLEDESPHRELFDRARAVVLNGSDEQNGALVLTIREQGYAGEIISLAHEPLHRPPMILAGASAVYTPLHILAAAMASLTRERISPRISGLGILGEQVQSAELRVDPHGELAGRTLAESRIRARTGATVIAQWRRGEFVPHPTSDTALDPGSILVAVGTAEALEALGKLATPLKREGPVVICGFADVLPRSCVTSARRSSWSTEPRSQESTWSATSSTAPPWSVQASRMPAR